MPDRQPTDRERVEVCVPCLILRSIVLDVRAYESDPETLRMCDEVTALLDQDVQTVFAGQYDSSGKVRRRAQKACDQAAQAMYLEDFAAVVLAFRLLVEQLSAEGYITLVADSNFDRAWTRFAAAVESSPEAHALDGPDVRGRASRAYKAVRRALRRRGLYR